MHGTSNVFILVLTDLLLNEARHRNRFGAV